MKTDFKLLYTLEIYDEPTLFTARMRGEHYLCLLFDVDEEDIRYFIAVKLLPTHYLPLLQQAISLRDCLELSGAEGGWFILEMDGEECALKENAHFEAEDLPEENVYLSYKLSEDELLLNLHTIYQRSVKKVRIVQQESVTGGVTPEALGAILQSYSKVEYYLPKILGDEKKKLTPTQYTGEVAAFAPGSLVLYVVAKPEKESLFGTTEYFDISTKSFFDLIEASADEYKEMFKDARPRTILALKNFTDSLRRFNVELEMEWLPSKQHSKAQKLSLKREKIMKLYDFFYAQEPEKESWNILEVRGYLKMVDLSRGTWRLEEVEGFDDFDKISGKTGEDEREQLKLLVINTPYTFRVREYTVFNPSSISYENKYTLLEVLDP